MDKYLTGIRSGSQNSFRAPKAGAATSSSAARHHPYARSGQVKEVSKLFEASTVEHIVSGSSGHQVNDTGGRSSAYIKERNARVEFQALERVQDSNVTVFRGLVVYINGYCRGTTDTELKRLVVSGGGKISHSNHGGVTHIITSMQLSAKKTEQFKNGKPRKLAHVVTPEWIKDCYEQRKRLQEWKYNVIDLKNDTHVSG
ncbi:unnamed protein product [Rhizoctonia solani]|uniref:BRCT domain-containing protein n=1 Tax=Rhizoctonia solani TaxID=456999 RepID=A0A8H3BED8_9AGAM|nr:unnamed protein product [Rhizoctonia solani]